MLEVFVTEEDIANGVPCDGVDCAVARAIRRKTGKAVNVSEAWIDWKSRSIRTPIEVYAFIRKFDRDEPVEPMSFELDVSSLFGGP